MSDLVRAVAFAFRRKNAASLSGTDLRMVLAFDLRWLAPEDAKRAVERAIATGLLQEDGAKLRPSFDVAAIEVPVNFRPGAALLDEDVPTDLPRARAGAPEAQPSAPAPQTAPPPPPPDEPDEEVEHALAREERAKRGNLVSTDVARLIVQRRAGKDVRAQAAALAQAILEQPR